MKKSYFQAITRRDFLSKAALTSAVTLGGLACLPAAVSWGKTGGFRKAKLREDYQGLSREELLKKAYELGCAYEHNSGGCSQSVVSAVHDILVVEDCVIRVANSFCGGMASSSRGTCGGLVGGTIALDYFCGRSKEQMSKNSAKRGDINALEEGMTMAKILYRKFFDKYGTILCLDIQQQQYGRYFYLGDQDEFKKMHESSSSLEHSKCLDIVGSSTRWAMEILLDHGIVEL